MTMETSYSVRFIGHYLLTFWKSRGKILSKSVMSPMARRFLSGVRDFAFCRPFLDSPRTLSSASVRGLFLCPSAVQKSRVCPGVWSTPKSGHSGPLFPAVDNAAIVN